MTMIQKEVFFDIESLFCAILRNPQLSGCDIKNKKNSIELREKFSNLDNVLFHHIARKWTETTEMSKNKTKFEVSISKSVTVQL